MNASTSQASLSCSHSQSSRMFALVRTTGIASSSSRAGDRMRSSRPHKQLDRYEAACAAGSASSLHADQAEHPVRAGRTAAQRHRLRPPVRSSAPSIGRQSEATGTWREATMTSNHTIRLYVLAASLLTCSSPWAAIAAHPWRAARRQDERRPARRPCQREQLLRRDMALVQKIATAPPSPRSRASSPLCGRQPPGPVGRTGPAPVAAPAVKVVTLPPLVITRTS